MRNHVLVLSSAVLLVLAGNCLAQAPAVSSFAGGTAFTTIDGTNLTAGWTFTANANLSVSALGFWQFDTTVPLTQSHQVGLWTSTGTLLASATVLVNSPVTGSWRYVAISPVNLISGQSYVVGSTLVTPFTDVYERVPVTGGSVVTLPSITAGESVISATAAGFAFPGIGEPANIARFGPNLMVAPISVPTISKGFNPTNIASNGTSALSFSISNPNTVSGLSSVGFSDTLPAGVVVSTPNGLTGSCGGGTITATAGSGSITLAGATLAATTACSFSVNVTGTSAGTKVNTTTAVTSTEGGNGSTATATLTVNGPPTIGKAFNPSSVATNGTSALSFTINNPNAGTSVTGVGFSDTLPAGVVVTTPNGLTGSCGGGTITATAGSGSITLAGATLAASASCTFSVNVNGTTAGTKSNTTGNVTSNEGGNGGTATATLTVNGPPTISKAFNPTSTGISGTSALSFTLSNPNAGSSLTGVAFSDTLPAGMVVSTPNGLSGSCGGGTITATAGSGTITLAGATLTASASCTFGVNVTPSTTGAKVNTTGTIASNEGGTGGTATATLIVNTAPTISKSFNPTSVSTNGTSALSFTVSNPNGGISLSGVAFSDTLPAGVVVSTPNGLTGSCGGGTITATAGAGAISLASATLAASASCTFSVNVTGTTVGTKNNVTGNITSNEGGTGTTASATLTVGTTTPPTISKSFTPNSIGPNGTSALSFTVTNPNAGISLTGLAFSDTLPAGVVVSTPNGLTGSCGGGTITATAGSGTITLATASLAASASCTFAVNVTGTTVGTKNNVTGAITSNEGGTGTTASATLTVNANTPPTISKSFSPTLIGPNGTSSLSFTVTNPNSGVSLTGLAFSDTLPSGVVVSTPNGLTGSCGGGTITATAGSGAISLATATLAASATCTFTVNVTGTTVGVKNNTTGNISSNEGGTGNTASATLTVGAASVPISPGVLAMIAFGLSLVGFLELRRRKLASGDGC